MPPKSKEQFEQIRQKSKAQIVQAAMELFARLGYHSTTISEIAKEAGVSKGLLYNYFAGKEALLQYIVMGAIEGGEELMHQSMSEVLDPRQQIRLLAQKAMYMISSNLHYWKLLTSIALQTDVLKGMEQIIEKKKLENLKVATELFKAIGTTNPELEAWYFGALMDGIALHYMQVGPGYPFEQILELGMERWK